MQVLTDGVFQNGSVGHIGPTQLGLFEYRFSAPFNPDLNSNGILLELVIRRGGGFTSNYDVYQDNADGFLMAAHILQQGPTGFSEGTVASTFVAPGQPNVVPEPATMVLLGTGLAAAVLRSRPRRMP